MSGASTGRHLQIIEDEGTRSSYGRLIQSVMAIFLVVTLCVMAFAVPSREFEDRFFYFIQNHVILLAVFAAMLLMLLWRKLHALLSRSKAPSSCPNKREATTDRIVAAVTMMLALVQVVSIHSYIFATEWDSGALERSAWSLANGGDLSIEYFSTYPNNLLLLRLIQECMRVAIRLGATRPESGVMLFCVANAVSCSVALWCVYWVLLRVVSTGCGIVGWLMSVLLLWTSPWAAIMYSDALLLGMAPLALALLVKMRSASYWQSVLLGFLFGAIVYVGYRIKPQEIFLLFAAALIWAVDLVRLIRARNRLVVMKVLCACFVVVGMVIASLAVDWGTQGLRSRLEEERQFGASHFLMMGLNPEMRGVYSGEDVAFSKSFATREERTKANLRVVRERLVAYGPVGFASLMHDKLLENYNDGTFAWGLEGGFFHEPFYYPDTLSAVTRPIYLIDGKYFVAFLDYEQVVWVAVLVFSVVGLTCFKVTRGAQEQGVHHAPQQRKVDLRKESNYLTTCISLVLLMSSGFQLLFEARARYLYIFSTLFVMLAAIGVWTLLGLAENE